MIFKASSIELMSQSIMLMEYQIFPTINFSIIPDLDINGTFCSTLVELKYPLSRNVQQSYSQFHHLGVGRGGAEGMICTGYSSLEQ